MFAIRVTAVLTLVTLTACSGSGYEATAEPAVTTTAAPTAEVWLTPDSPAYMAQQAWGLPLQKSYDVIFLPQTQLNVDCGRAKNEQLAVGCATTNMILLRDDLPGDPRQGAFAAVLMHEMGHVLAHEAGHPSSHIDEAGCSNDTNADSVFLMCAWGGLLPAPTERDYQWLDTGN